VFFLFRSVSKRLKAQGTGNHNSKERIKIVEKSGQDIENILSKKDPFQKEICKEKACPICQNPKSKM
jgi:hypothetical protein